MKKKQVTWQQWARVQLGISQALPALTGQDIRALSGIVSCWELYACGDESGKKAAIEGVRALLPGMQAQLRWLAKELIPFALDWDDRERLWPLVEARPSRGKQDFDPSGRWS